MKAIICVFAYVAWQLTLVTSDSAVKDLFKHANRDHSNDCLTKTEFNSIFLEMDAPPQDNRISYREFIQGWNHDHLNDHEDVPFFFSEFDSQTRDLYITLDEMEFAFKEFDMNHDDCVSEQEMTFTWEAMFNQ